MGCYPQNFEEVVKMKYNMGFYFDNPVIEASFLAGLELEGIEVRHLGGGRYSAYGLSEDHRHFIEQRARKFWAF